MLRAVHAFLVSFSALSFLGFGAACFLSASMRKEFARYRLARQRPWIGILQLMGALGLLAGLALPAIGLMAAAGLAFLMLLGVGVRIRIKDTLLQTMPALFYLTLNAYLCFAAF